MSKIIELQEKRTKVIADSRALIDKVEKENRGLNADERVKWDGMMDDADDIKSRIDTLKRQYEEERDLAIIDKVTAGKFDTEQRASKGKDADNGITEDRAFDSFLRRGVAGLTIEERTFVENRASTLPEEVRALSVSTTGGGYTVPDGFRNTLDDALLRFGGMRQSRATVMPTESGASLPMPTSNDTSNSGAIVAINTQVASNADPVFGQAVLGAYMYTSKIVLVPIQLLQDSAFDIGAWLGQKLGERIGRATNAHFTTGTGSSQPSGVVTGASSGKVGATGQTATVVYNDIVDLVHSVDPAYRMDAEFMFSDSTLKVIRKLVDGNSLPLWNPSITSGEPSQILGYNYTVNQDVPVMAANAKSMLFGDMSKYIIRDVRGAQLLRLQERYADFLQVGFMAFSRHDGILLDAGTKPVKFYQNSAT